MSKLNVRNTIINAEIEAEVFDYFEDEGEALVADLVADVYEDMVDYDERAYTLSFHNWMLPCGEGVLNIYRQFDHTLLTFEQAHSVMLDVSNELCDMIEANGGQVIFSDDYVEDYIEVCFELPNDPEFSHSAYIWVMKAESIEERSVDALDDKYWLAPEELDRVRRINAIELDIPYLEGKIALLEERYKKAWSEWTFWVTRGRSYVEGGMYYGSNPERYLEQRRAETKREALALGFELDDARQELKGLKDELRQL